MTLQLNVAARSNSAADPGNADLSLSTYYLILPEPQSAVACWSMNHLLTGSGRHPSLPVVVRGSGPMEHGNFNKLYGLPHAVQRRRRGSSDAHASRGTLNPDRLLSSRPLLVRVTIPRMDPTLAAAAIGVTGTVIVGLAGFGATIWTTRQTIASARESRIWEKRAATYVDVLAAIHIRQINRTALISALDQRVASTRRADGEEPDWLGLEARLQTFAS